MKKNKKETIKQMEYDAEEIINKRVHLNKVQYLVKWSGYSEADNTWEPISNLLNVKHLIDQFEEKAYQRFKRIAKPAKAFVKNVKLTYSIPKTNKSHKSVSISSIEQIPNETKHIEQSCCLKQKQYKSVSKSIQDKIININENNTIQLIEQQWNYQNNSIKINTEHQKNIIQQIKNNQNLNLNEQKFDAPLQNRIQEQIPAGNLNLQDYMKKSQIELSKGRIISFGQIIVNVEILSDKNRVSNNHLVSLSALKQYQQTILQKLIKQTLIFK